MKKTSSRLVLSLLCVVLLAVMAACSGNSKKEASPSATPSAGGSSSAGADNPYGIDWEARKAANKEAGKIKFITSFNYAASAPSVNAVVADELGYFEELGLDVEVIPGLEAEGMKLLAAGQVQFGGSGTASTVIQSIVNDAEIKGLAVMSPVGLGALMVLEESGIQEPKDLEGKTVGYKGALPASFKAMFRNAGADIDKINLVSVGFDPSILVTTDVDAITVFKSNEPNAMEKMGHKVRLIDPQDYGINSSFGVVVGNNKFVEKHPTAAEDFLRALFKAQEYLKSNPDDTIKILEGRSETTYNVDTESNRLKVEMEIIESSKIEGHGIGWHTEQQWQDEIVTLVSMGSIKNALAVDTVMNNTLISSIYDGDKLIWIE
ncbi:ABC transporter substrate-binding protein [Paenibacillaceae bacterium WGS1546]|uniref:ABC transporter substrate-binding protein n=1 Tax=Cohnella sp. WGS1546 TaxID=3366810 RepID=UPI00372D78B0